MSALARSRVGGALSLRDFLHKSKVLNQYRAFFRETTAMDATAAQELRRQIRAEYKLHKGEASAAQRRALLNEGTRQLQSLRKYSGASLQAKKAAGGDSLPADTWVGTGEAFDIRGRIGVGFPWSSSSS